MDQLAVVHRQVIHLFGDLCVHMVLVYRWSCIQVVLYTGGPCMQVVLVYRWSLYTGGPCIQVVLVYR